MIQGTMILDTLAFMGIPYAEPPVGLLRWRAPQDPAPWSGVLDTVSYSSPCAQNDKSDTGGALGSEDCLYLNVFVPQTPTPSGPLPVMFYIHGGSNFFGSGADPIAGVENLLPEKGNVVLVTANFRLGVFGWLAHPALTAEDPNLSSGNYGLLDIVHALRWVQTNIANFGGDPNRVMISGGSSGSTDTCALVASPLASGLFHAALQSSWPCKGDDLAAMEQIQGIPVATETGCQAMPSLDQQLECMRGLSTNAWLLAQANTFGMEKLAKNSVDPKIDNFVLIGHPEQVMQAGAHNKVPFIIGAQKYDQYNPGEPSIDDLDQFKAAVSVILSEFGIVPGSPSMASNLQTVLGLYPLSTYGSYQEAYIQLENDVAMHCPNRRIAMTMAANQQEPVWWYVLDHSLAGNLSKFLSYHEMMLDFWTQKITVGETSKGPYSPNPDDLKIAAEILDYWVTFASTGDPNSGKSPFWPVVDSSIKGTPLIISTFSQSPPDYEGSICDYWDNLTLSFRGY